MSRSSTSYTFVNLAAVATLLICAVLPWVAQSADDRSRPRIGLVLAGGGAKGGAHVGVLKVLEEQHIPIDCIAGTSMGALIGGGYASGIPATELEKFLVNVNWKKVVGNQGQRKLEPVEQKRAGATYSNNFEFGVTADGVTAPGGIIATSNIEDLLRIYVASARLETDFNKLPIPFRAIATDMVSGKMVILDHGDIATAMRASMAIPGAFAPVVTDNKILSDGGLVRNIPIDIARDLCADVVIVVNLVEPAANPKKLQSALQLLNRTMDVMIEANETLQLQTLGPRDVLVNVEMGTIGTSDFERIAETIPLGESAARAMASDLTKWSIPEQQYLAWRKTITASQTFKASLADVRFEGLQRVNPQYLAKIDPVKAGDIVDTVAISNAAQKMSVLQDFDSVGYRLDGDPQTPTLTWLPREKNWGPNYFKVDFGVYTSANGELTFNLYGRHVRTWLNSLGGEWRSELQIGGESLLNTSFFQPLDAAHRFFVEPHALLSRSLEDIYSDNVHVARYKFRDVAGLVDFGVNIGTYAQARIGYLYDSRKVDVDIGSPLLPETRRMDAGLLVSADFDNRDTAFNPTHGVAIALEYMRSDLSLGADRHWERAELGVGVAVPTRRDVIWMTAAGGSNLGSNLPPDRALAIGGPSSFPGLYLGELRVDNYWTVGTKYLWNIKDMLSIRNLALYAGIGLNAGEIYDRLDQGKEGFIYGGSIFLTGRTLIGPLTVGLGAVSLDSWSLWISVGRPVGHGTILEKGIFR